MSKGKRSTTGAARPLLIVWLVAWLALSLAGCRQAGPEPVPGNTPDKPENTPPVQTLAPTQPLAAVGPGQPDFQPQAALLAEDWMDLPALANAPRYAIQLNLDYPATSFAGNSRLEYSNTEAIALDSLYFRLLPNANSSYGNGALDVSQVLVNGQPAETALSGSDTVLEVRLSEELAPGQKATLEFEFAGHVTEDFGGPEAEAGYGIYNLSEGVLALAGWYPILAVYDQDGWNLDPVSNIGDSVYSDAGLYVVDVQAPQELVIASSGSQTERREEDGRSWRRFQSGPAREFFLIASPDFQQASRVVDGTQVNSYSLPGNAGPGEQALDVAAASLEIFNEQLGPYPYRELDVVEAPMRYAVGVEFPGIFLIASKLYESPDEPTFATTIAHETAHQWWYNVVGNDVFDEPWLDEGLTTYSSALYYEFESGPRYLEGLLDYWRERYAQLKEKGEDDTVTQPLAYFEGLGQPGIYSGVVYVKGALFFDALREEIGDQAFFAGLQQYYRDHQFGIAETGDLLAAFEQASGRELDDFYQKWLYSVE